MGNWITSELCELNEENMNLLLDFKIPGIIVRGFLPIELCKEVAKSLVALSFESYDHLKEIPVNHIGLCHNQWANDKKDVYFGKKQQAQQVIDNIYEKLSIDPVKMVTEALTQRSGRQAAIFEEPGFGSYFAGAFRSFRGHGKLHVDHAPTHILKPWAVTEISRQMTWNLYYSQLDSGGELVIYDTIHTSQNEPMKVAGDYYFPYEVLESKDCISLIPKVGDLIIFNTQNFHEILGNSSGGHRVSQTSFIGLKADGSLGLWS
ncbi:2OG-Fe(II) oxygenase [Pseudomonas amygdali]|uniref:2OG-Fe(II)-dependent halogenase WelO5 family protein n=1 Tax=Pseudomonas amygdali TaxID=47877 RepID=UPI0006B90D8B|nr:2OG-Fe(II) oxygenase [Pseudomonas amygdali]RMV79859.1 hypothetical protein ALP04_02864 [Pseudomonas amygdali pv. sesami]